MNLDKLKSDFKKASSFLRGAASQEFYASFNGTYHTLDGVRVVMHMSGHIDVCDAIVARSDDITNERKELAEAYQYYLDVRKAAKAIARELLPNVVYIRNGRSFEKLVNIK